MDRHVFRMNLLQLAWRWRERLYTWLSHSSFSACALCNDPGVQQSDTTRTGDVCNNYKLHCSGGSSLTRGGSNCALACTGKYYCVHIFVCQHRDVSWSETWVHTEVGDKQKCSTKISVKYRFYSYSNYCGSMFYFKGTKWSQTHFKASDWSVILNWRVGVSLCGICVPSWVKLHSLCAGYRCRKKVGFF